MTRVAPASPPPDGVGLSSLSSSLLFVAALKRRRKKPPTLTRSRSNSALAQVFPADNASPATRRQAQRRISAEVGEEHLRRLHALFHTCDADEDGVLTATELVVLLQLIGMSESDAIAAAAAVCSLSPIDVAVDGAGGSKTETIAMAMGISFERFLADYREVVTACHTKRCELPSPAFVARCQPLKRGFRNCDTDGSLVISRTELEIALQKLDVILGDDELDCIMALLDCNADGTIEWSEFLFAAWRSSRCDAWPVADHATSTLQQYFNVEIFTDLPSFIRVSPSGEGGAGEKSPSAVKTTTSSVSSMMTAPTGYVSRIEHLGIRLLTRASEARVSTAKRLGSVQAIGALASGLVAPLHPLAQRASTHPVGTPPHLSGNGISDEKRRAIFRLEALATLVGALAGVLFGLLAIGLDAAIFPVSLDADAATYYAYASLLNIGVSLVEVHVLYLTTLVSAFRLTVSANLILYPLDREREFLTRSIARAALQAGDRKDVLFGVDPMRGSPRLVATVTLLLYKTKRYALKFLLKLLIKRVLWRAAARTALSLLVLPVNALSNAWTLRRVMRHCRVNIIGPPCVVAVLEVFLLEDTCVAPRQRVDYLRAIGCALVSKRAIHPNAEIMLQFLRHKWLCTDLWPCAAAENGGTPCSCMADDEAPCAAHALDDKDELISSLEQYRAACGVDGSGGAAAKEAAIARCSIRGGDGDGDGESPRRRAAGLSEHRHVRNVFFLLVVSLIIDGSLGWAERRLYVRCCQAAGVPNHWSHVLRLKQAFVAGHGIDVDAVFALVEARQSVASADTGDGGDASDDAAGDAERDEDSTRVPVSESLQYVWNRLASLLSC